MSLLVVLATLLWVAETLDRFPRPPDEGDSVLAVPVFSPPPGIYDRNALRVTLRATHPRGKIIFTTDGTIPSVEVGILYERPLQVSGMTVIRAIEVVDNVPSPVATATYAVGVPGALPILSLAIEPSALWDVKDGMLTHPWARGADWERWAEMTYLAREPDENLSDFIAPLGLRVHSVSPVDVSKPALRMYFRKEYGLSRLEYPLFASHPAQAQSYKRLLLQAGDRGGRWTLFRDQLLVDIAGHLGLPASQGRFVHLFVNGESWGLYRLSERIDRFFLAENCGLRNVDLVQDGKPREGTDDDWDALMDWLELQTLSDPHAYARLSAQIDLDNFTDFAILQLYFGFPSSELYAARPVGGQWFFLYEGGSQAFAAYSDTPLTLFEDADFALVLRKLLENPSYQQIFTRRLSILLNTVLAADQIQQRTQVLVDSLQKDIVYEVTRWPTPLLWEDNVTSFSQEFAEGRPSALWSQVAEFLDIETVIDMNFEVAPLTAGHVYLEGIPFEEYSNGQARFFVGDIVTAVAVPEVGYDFAGWDGDLVCASPVLTISVGTLSEVRARFVLESSLDSEVNPDDVIINELWINDQGTRYASLGNRPIEGDWIELLVQTSHPVDMRGWRLTDNNTKNTTSEGSIIFPPLYDLSAVPSKTVILILASEHPRNALYFPVDDMDPHDRQLVFYVGNGNLDVSMDPGFGLSPREDTLALLAPGASDAFVDDIGVDFVGEGYRVTPYTFGILADGVTFDVPFHLLGADDGAYFAALGRNDAVQDWVVDPPAYASGDEVRVDSPNMVTPGKLNPQQRLLWLLEGVR